MVERERDEQTAAAAEYCDLVARAALAERDSERVARVLRVTVRNLPSRLDAPGVDDAEAWLFILSDLPVWAVERAGLDYARRNKWRPAPAEIVTRAEAVARPVERIARNSAWILERVAA